MFPSNFEEFLENDDWAYATPPEQATGVAPQPFETEISLQTTSLNSAALFWSQSAENQATSMSQPAFYPQLDGVANYGDQWPPQFPIIGYPSTPTHEYPGYTDSLLSNNHTSARYSEFGDRRGIPTFHPPQLTSPLAAHPAYFPVPLSMLAATIPPLHDSASSSQFIEQDGLWNSESAWSANSARSGLSSSSQDRFGHIATGPSFSPAIPHRDVQLTYGHFPPQDWVNRGFHRTASQTHPQNASVNAFGTMQDIVPPNFPHPPNYSTSSAHDVHYGMQAEPSSGPILQRTERRSTHSTSLNDATVEELTRLEYGRGSRPRRNRNGSRRSGATSATSIQHAQSSQTSNQASGSSVINAYGPRAFKFVDGWSITRIRNCSTRDELIPPTTPSRGQSETTADAEKHHNLEEKGKRAEGPCKSSQKKRDNQKILRQDIARYVKEIQVILTSRLGDGSRERSEDATLADLIPYLGGTIPPRRRRSAVKKLDNQEQRRFFKDCLVVVYEALTNKPVRKENSKRYIWETVMKKLRDQYGHKPT